MVAFIACIFLSVVSTASLAMQHTELPGNKPLYLEKLMIEQKEMLIKKVTLDVMHLTKIIHNLCTLTILPFYSNNPLHGNNLLNYYHNERENYSFIKERLKANKTLLQENRVHSQSISPALIKTLEHSLHLLQQTQKTHNNIMKLYKNTYISPNQSHEQNESL